ncbi:MAG: hypothetical protein U5K69_00970 [Balneolaceae bacterium]|nr:hypothetical protein [Balneolaceae bacterium]
MFARDELGKFFYYTKSFFLAPVTNTSDDNGIFHLSFLGGDKLYHCTFFDTCFFHPLGILDLLMESIEPTTKLRPCVQL